MTENEILCLLGKAARREHLILAVSLREHMCLVGAAKARDRLHQRVKDRLKVDRRAADDLENVASCGELVNRAREFGRSITQFLEQPRILDRNHGLVSKSLHQFDLFVRKRPSLFALERENPHYSFFPP